MDPTQVIAARQVSIARKSAAEEIDAFYDNNACEALNATWRALGLFARLLRSLPGHIRRAVTQSPKIASAPWRA